MMPSPAFAGMMVAMACAGVMGFAIQRGATCTVAAIGEIVEERRARRLAALFEAALLVAGILVFTRLVGLTMSLPDGFSVTGWTLAGGGLLGVGAYVNRACVFGSIARLGSGEWAYVLTPFGFYLGSLTLAQTLGSVTPAAVQSGSHVPVLAAVVIAAYFGWRVAVVGRQRLRARKAQRVRWSPHEATLVIGLTFVILDLTVGPWAYTDLLSQLAWGQRGGIQWRTLLFAALFAGAVLGGRTAGLTSKQGDWRYAAARCLAGGLLMGWGSALIPGGNDSLILVGMPLLQAQAWAAILMMCATIWIALSIEKRCNRIPI